MRTCFERINLSLSTHVGCWSLIQPYSCSTSLTSCSWLLNGPYSLPLKANPTLYVVKLSLGPSTSGFEAIFLCCTISKQLVKELPCAYAFNAAYWSSRFEAWERHGVGVSGFEATNKHGTGASGFEDSERVIGFEAWNSSTWCIRVSIYDRYNILLCLEYCNLGLL